MSLSSYFNVIISQHHGCEYRNRVRNSYRVFIKYWRPLLRQHRAVICLKKNGCLLGSLARINKSPTWWGWVAVNFHSF